MPPSPDIQIEVFGKTDVGLIREHNEDNFLIADITAGVRSNSLTEPMQLALGDKGVVLLVCDGMGGAAAGEVAAQMAVDSVYQTLSVAARWRGPTRPSSCSRATTRANAAWAPPVRWRR
jgi:protein phosphatase